MNPLLIIAGLAGWLALAPPVAAADPVASAEMPIYIPPKTGAPEMRVGGGPRGLHGMPGGMRISAIAPSHIAHSLQAQPKLYWVLSRGNQPAPVKARLTLSEIDLTTRIDTTILDQVAVALPAQVNGVQQIDLKNYNIRLKAGTDYAWAVTVDNPPLDEDKAPMLEADGWVKHVPVSPELEACLAAKSDRVLAYAACGLWYDAIAELFARLSKNPQDSVMQAARNALLDQIGIAVNEIVDK